MNKNIVPIRSKPKSFTLRTTITLSQDDLTHSTLIRVLEKSDNKAQLIRTLMLRGLVEYIKDDLNEAK